MVPKKRLDCGLNGHRAPIIPRAPRSIRWRGPRKKLVEENKFCAFELLAAVAGKLLQESESSAASNVAEGKVEIGTCGDGNHKGQSTDVKTLISESHDHGSCAESAFFPEISWERNLLSNFKGLSQAGNDSVFENTSIRESSEFPSKVDCDIKLGTSDINNTSGTDHCKMVEASVCIGDNLYHKVENGSELQSEDHKNQIGSLSVGNKSSVKDPVGECVSNNLLNSESSVQLPLYRDRIPGALLRKHGNLVKLGIRDDDESSFGYNKSYAKFRHYKPRQSTGHRRIRKTLTFKYWKVIPKLKDCELYSTSEGMRSFGCRKGIYARERYLQAHMKRRKLSDRSFAVPYDQDGSSDSISNLPGREMRGDNGGSAGLLHRAGASSATAKGHTKTEDPHVKFSIKSFWVPELYIEVSETATVGSLKRKVMEAVTTILGGGIRVGVVLQGKKVRDDSRTLRQAGITENNDLDALGFTLEPSFTNVSPCPTSKKLPHVFLCDSDQPIKRNAATQVIDSGISNATVDPSLTAKLDGDTDNCNECIYSPRNPPHVLTDGVVVTDSKALVPVPPLSAEALAVVPVNPKLKHSELSQRRTRRPFSVAEVEALVEAVEKLGTGRWRDVKMRAFENAEHRTYVDLKDKWKTLVHTASISPQQRRGEPVPQDLLNRVLAAHSFWSQHQSKHGKHPTVDPPLKIVDAREEVL